MTGDYTKVALRAGERWETAPTQQGRALLDHDLNLNPAASVRRDRHLARDAIGSAGVVEGSSAFQIGVTPSGPLDLTVDAGRIWVDGLAALATEPFLYSEQDQIAALPGGGRALVFLDVWEEHIQPAEDVALIDPALAPTDTAARTRVGYRVRAVATTATTCASAWSGFDPAQLSTGRLTVHRVGPAAPADPCDPPGDAQGLVPDGLLRVEVLDGGPAASARFAWSYDNGAAAVPIASVAGDTVTLLPSSSVKFGADLVEISWLARRADRLNAGSLYQVIDVTPSATGDVLTLDRAVTAPPGADGLVARRWDGNVIGAATDQNADRGGNDFGIRFGASSGTFRAGDWWGARVREADGLEELNNAVPDGTRHSFAPLALVDLDARSVIDDCRPTFLPLTEIETGSPCTVVVRPGSDLQAAVDALPAGGGEVCLSAGEFVVSSPVVITGRDRVRVAGVGPATIVRVIGGETVLRFVNSDQVELLDLALVADVAASPVDAESLNGAATFQGCRGVAVRAVRVSVPDGGGRAQTAITVREAGNRRPEAVRIELCDLDIGAWQTGVLVTEGADVVIDGNRVGINRGLSVLGQGIVVGGRRIVSLRVSANTIRNAIQGIHVGASHSGFGTDLATEVLVTGNTVHLSVPSSYARERHAVFVGNASSIQVTDTRATIERTGAVPGTADTPVDGIRLIGFFGPYAVVRGASMSGFHVGVRAEPLSAGPAGRLWAISEVSASGRTGAVGAVAPTSFVRTLVVP